MAYKKTGVVKDAETMVVNLDRLCSSTVALQTGAANGASVVFSLYGRVQKDAAWVGPIEMTDPTNSAAAITTLTGTSKSGVTDRVKGFSQIWAKRTDADASTAATIYVNVTTEGG